MRSIEIILIFLAFLFVARPWLPTLFDKYRRHLTLFAFITLALHVLLEGIRWTMIPSYVLVIVGTFPYKRSRLVQSLFVATIPVAVALPLILPVFQTPPPTGPYSIGTLTFAWTDSSRLEWFTDENPNDYRRIVVELRYPAEKTTGKPARYLDNISKRADAIGKAGGFPGFLICHLGLVPTHSFPIAPLKTNADPLPIIIISHGITGNRQLHTSLAEELTSHGYIVASLDHPYDANITLFPDGSIADYRSDLRGLPNDDSVRVRKQQLETRVADVCFLLDQLEKLNSGSIHTSEFTYSLAGCLDLQRVGVAGHSYGGATAIMASYLDPRFKAVLVLDGWMNPLQNAVIEKGIVQPLLSLSRPQWNDSDYLTSPALMERFTRSQLSHQNRYIIEGTRHLDFSDAPLLSPLSDYVIESGPISPHRIIDLVNRFSCAYFDDHLRGSNIPVSTLTDSFPEVVLQ